MVLSAGGVHLIASFEGFVPHWYDDGTGVQTIGFGHTGALPAGFAAPLSEAAGLELLRHDTAGYAAAVSRLVRVRLGVIPSHAAARFAALVSFAFNVGEGAFASSYVLHLVNLHGAPRDWRPPATAMLAWDHAGGRVLEGLLRRRQIEGSILVSGVLPTGAV